MARTYDTIRLPGSARDSKILVAANGQTANRALLQLLAQQYVTDSSYTRTTNIFSGGIALQPSAGQAVPYV